MNFRYHGLWDTHKPSDWDTYVLRVRELAKNNNAKNHSDGNGSVLDTKLNFIDINF